MNDFGPWLIRAANLLNALSKIDKLRVAARTSAFSFKGKTVDVGTIARTLGVTGVLDGSIRRSGSRLRISVQLVDAADGYQVWSERYDREMRDVFELDRRRGVREPAVDARQADGWHVVLPPQVH